MVKIRQRKVVMNWFTTSDLLKRTGPFVYSLDYIIWYAVLGLLLVGAVIWLVKKGTPKIVKILLIVLWAIAVAFDLAKLILAIVNGFVLTGSLPLYICSIFMYAMPFALWGKGKIKEMACTYVCTIGLFGALMNYVVPSVTLNYSLFSFWGLHTTIYHSMLLIVPFVMLCTGYHKIKIKDFGWAFLGFVILTISVVAIDYIIKADYMYFRTAETTSLGFVMNIAAATSWFWPVLMYVGYAVVQIVMTSLVIGIVALVRLIKKSCTKAPNETITEEKQSEMKNETNGQ